MKKTTLKRINEFINVDEQLFELANLGTRITGLVKHFITYVYIC